MVGFKLDLDPSLTRVCLVGLLLMAELVLIKLVEILSQNRAPTVVEIALFLCLGLLQLVTYILAFLRKDES